MKTNSLTFLYEASNEDLRVLVDIITRDRHGNSRLTEELTCTPIYKYNYPDNLHGMIPKIIDEFERFGGNTFANILRGGGKDYAYILRKVAKRLKVSFNSNNSDETVERYMIQKLFDDISTTLTDEQLREMLVQMGVRLTHFSRQAAIAALQAVIRTSGFQSYIWLVTIANAVARMLLGRGLSFAANAALTRWVAVFTGPLGWALTALWTAFDIAGPAYRVTIPAVIQIAYMRQKARYGELVQFSSAV